MSGSVFGKIAATMLVPMIAVGAVAGVALGDAIADIADLDQSAASLHQLDTHHRAARAVGQERLLAALAALPEPPPEVVDEETQERWQADSDGALGRVEGRPEDLDWAVEAVAAARSTPVQRSTNFGRATSVLLEAAARIEVTTDDARTALGVATSRSVHELIETTDRAWIDFAERPSDSDRVVADVLDSLVATRVIDDRVTASSAGGPIDAIIDETSAATAVMDELRLIATEDLLNPGEEIVTPDAALFTLVDARQRWVSAAERIGTELDRRVGELRSDAQTRRDSAAVLGLFAILIIGAAGMVLYGAVSGPIEVLAGDTEQFAEYRLPTLAAALATPADAPSHAPSLTATAGPELDRLVTAVNHSHDGLYGLARIHARSRRHLAGRAVTLSAKNTRLLQELVRLVSSWRGTDESPETRLRLFQIDHLATRMQRNAEALLLLAGSHAMRHWSNPVSATNVARLALGEIGAFDRVDIEPIDSVRISGQIAPDVAHLLAELIENALNAADPRKGPTAQRVKVDGLWVSAGFAFTIRDQARGMNETERAEVNRRLHTPVVDHEGPTDCLGLHIVAHLAQRHGIDVRLLEAPDGGTVARVVLPVDLIDPTTIPTDRKPIEAGRGTEIGAVAGARFAPPIPTEPQAAAARTFFGDSGGTESIEPPDRDSPGPRAVVPDRRPSTTPGS